MGMKETILSLSSIEKQALLALSKSPETAEEIARKAKMNIDSARRAASWLSEKGLAKISGQQARKTVPTKEGLNALEKGLPERRMLLSLAEKESIPFSEMRQSTGLSAQEFNIALGMNKRKAFVAVMKKDEPAIMLTSVGKEFLRQESEEEKALREIKERGAASNSEALKELVARGLAEEKEAAERKISITPEGEQARELKEFSSAQREYNVLDRVPEVYIGKKQPYIQFLNIIRRKLTELGFKEMEAPLIVHEFYNFDVLFQPQNHPARTWTDTYQLKNPASGNISDRSRIAAIKAAHENGGVSGSRGWGYVWKEEIAQKLMPTAHGTAHSARQLTKGVESPGKYFAIARCFRPDVLDATHLIEFNQTEGFIVGEDLNFTHLLGVLEQFAREIAGAQEVKFLPDYYPFTEPSCQLSAKHPKLGWIELGGAGMFRPEILENLGIKGQAIAWGIGIDRLAMFKLGIHDIRYLFSDDLDWLRKRPLVVE